MSDRSPPSSVTTCRDLTPCLDYDGPTRTYGQLVIELNEYKRAYDRLTRNLGIMWEDLSDSNLITVDQEKWYATHKFLTFMGFDEWHKMLVHYGLLKLDSLFRPTLLFQDLLHYNPYITSFIQNFEFLRPPKIDENDLWGEMALALDIYVIVDFLYETIGDSHLTYMKSPKKVPHKSILFDYMKKLVEQGFNISQVNYVEDVMLFERVMNKLLNEESDIFPGETLAERNTACISFLISNGLDLQPLENFSCRHDEGLLTIIRNLCS